MKKSNGKRGSLNGFPNCQAGLVSLNLWNNLIGKDGAEAIAEVYTSVSSNILMNTFRVSNQIVL